VPASRLIRKRTADCPSVEGVAVESLQVAEIHRRSDLSALTDAEIAAVHAYLTARAKRIE
jgi:hypothetical protein